VTLVEPARSAPDAVLLHRARAGDTAAFGALYSTHLAAARRLARTLLADPSDAEDVVAEVFAASFAATKKGRGPVDDFRSYLLTSVRRECQRAWRRGARQRPRGATVTELAADRAAGHHDEADLVAEEQLVRRAFAALPPRMQRVLWLTEVEGRPHDVVAEELGTSTSAVAQLARRARQQFGARYLAGHLTAPGDGCGPACTEARRVLAEVVRGTAGRRARRVATKHLAGCAACAAAYAELEVVNARLRSGHAIALLPLVTAAGGPGRLGLLARLAAWASGPVPAMSAAATIAVATAVVPVPEDRPARPGHRVEAPAEASAPAPTILPAPAVHPAGDLVVTIEPAPRPGSRDDLTVGLLPADPVIPTAEDAAPPTTATPAPTEEAPTGAASPPADAPGLHDDQPAGAPAEPAVPPPPPAQPPAAAPVLGPLPDVTGAVEDVVNGITIDDPVVAAVTPVVGALPEVGVAVTVPPVEVLPPVVSTPPVGVGVDVGGGEIGVGVDLGDAHVGLSVGPQGGATVQLPTVPEVVDQLPIVPGVLDSIPLTRGLLGGG
jgi:RNA polymerase sigma factor (sigma-70 family)